MNTHLLFSPHNDQHHPYHLFTFTSAHKGRVCSQMLAKNIPNTTFSYIHNSQQGPLYVIFRNGKSIGTFWITNKIPNNSIAYTSTSNVVDPDVNTIDDCINNPMWSKTME